MKTILFLIMIPIELLCLAIGWLLAFTWLRGAQWFANHCIKKLPDYNWYFPEKSNK